MHSKDEKLSLLSEMIQFAKADKNFKEQEYNFIVAVASQLGIEKEEVDFLMKGEVEKKSLQPESQRILQFHRLVLLMNIDQEASPLEIQAIKDMGLKMGLRLEAVDTVLEKMHEYPNKVIPPKELIAIFTTFYN
ncbi:TerB family tellurite resistance protein [Aquimarina aquimarini]|uniref:TerB family tellurite resistance protein n=1 Tax=Aquimarina aquimarini TaxID=1191734 RepID=UPI000D5589BF|nr:TerB family tellurite resistance protein [Aquimarina aquimarini]